MVARRGDASAQFGRPEALPFPEIPGGDFVAYDNPQFVRDGLDLSFRVLVKRQGASAFRYLLARRDAMSDSFHAPEPLDVEDPRARHFISADGLRAYIVRLGGIQICSRRSLESPFSSPGNIRGLAMAKTGKMEGPIWICPGEDVFFYSSPVVDPQGKLTRCLRMFRFR